MSVDVNTPLFRSQLQMLKIIKGFFSKTFKITKNSFVLPVLEFHDTPLWDFRTPTDMVLIVEDHEFYVHKSVLAKASPVFKVMLESGDFKEKNMGKIELPGKSKEDIHRLLLFLYPYGFGIKSNCVLDITYY